MQAVLAVGITNSNSYTDQLYQHRSEALLTWPLRGAVASSPRLSGGWWLKLCPAGLYDLELCRAVLARGLGVAAALDRDAVCRSNRAIGRSGLDVLSKESRVSVLTPNLRPCMFFRAPLLWFKGRSHPGQQSVGRPLSNGCQFQPPRASLLSHHDETSLASRKANLARQSHALR